MRKICVAQVDPNDGLENGVNTAEQMEKVASIVSPGIASLKAQLDEMCNTLTEMKENFRLKSRIAAARPLPSCRTFRNWSVITLCIHSAIPSGKPIDTTASPNTETTAKPYHEGSLHSMS